MCCTMATKTLQRAGWARVAKQHHHHSPSSWRRPPFPLYRARCQRMPFVAQFTATPEYESVNIFPNDSVRSCVCVCALFPRVEGFACLYPPACMLFLLFVPAFDQQPDPSARVAVHGNIIFLHCSLCFSFVCFSLDLPSIAGWGSLFSFLTCHRLLVDLPVPRVSLRLFFLVLLDEYIFSAQ